MRYTDHETNIELFGANPPIRQGMGPGIGPYGAIVGTVPRGEYTRRRHKHLLSDIVIFETSGQDLDQNEDLNIDILVNCTNSVHQIGVPIISWYRYLWSSGAMVPEHPIRGHVQVI